MRRTDALIIGGGQAGLAMSRCLADRGVDHVVLERGRVAERWRSERWDSLRLLTPRWQSRLPGWRYAGPDPDGYMAREELVAYLERYARSFVAPVREHTSVLAVERASDGYRVLASDGEWRASSVVIATGHCDAPLVPAMAARVSPRILQMVPSRYRCPEQLPCGGVLIVGASATGVQLAEELQRSGRSVTLAVGRHTRLPRRYRGRDIMRWLDRAGILGERAEDVLDLEAARAEPSLQLVGRADQRAIDLGVVQAIGVTLAGRAVDASGDRVRFAEDLPETMARADRKLRRVLARIDDHIARSAEAADDAEPIDAIAAPPAPCELDLGASDVRTIVWATGYARRYPWLRVPVLDARGELRHEGGVTPSPGLYVLGLRFLRRRSSSFIDGVGADAAELAEHVRGHLARCAA